MKLIPLEEMNLWTTEESEVRMLVKMDNSQPGTGPKDWWEYLDARKQMVWILANNLLEGDEAEMEEELDVLEESWERSSDHFGVEPFPHPNLLRNKKLLEGRIDQIRPITDLMTYDEVSAAAMNWQLMVERALEDEPPVYGGKAVVELMGKEEITLSNLLINGGMWL